MKIALTGVMTILIVITLFLLTVDLENTSAASINSPLYQLQSGVAVEDITCKENKVLALRANGNPVCVSEKSAERMEWKIIKQNIPTPIVSQDNLIKEKEIIIEKIPETKPLKENTEQVYFEIWNPIPEDQRDDIAELFVKAADDTIIEKDGIHVYDTKHGKMHMANTPVIGALGATISYGLSLEIHDADKQREFIYNFMEKASLDHSNIKLVERDQRRYVEYYFQTDRNLIDFKFNYPPLKGVTIALWSWSNNPNPVTYELSEQEALKKVSEYSQQTEFSYYQIVGGEECETTLFDPPYGITKYYLWGEPYYVTTIGHCDYPSREGLESFSLDIIIDGTKGENIFYKFTGGEGT